MTGHPPSLAFTTPLTLLVLGAAPFAEGTDYEGAGFVGPTYTEDAAQSAETLDLDGDGLLDLVVLETSGAIAFNPDLATRSHWDVRAGFQALAVTRFDQDRLWAVTLGDELVEVRASDLAGATSPVSTGVTLPGLVALDAQQRPAGARLVAVHAGGATAAVYQPQGSGWKAMLTRTATGAQGAFLDAVIVDWNDDGSDDLAVISALGLHVYDPAGLELVFLPGDPAGAFLDAFPGASVKWGRDLLVYHHRTTPEDPHLIWLANAFHGEVHYTQDCYVREVLLADFLTAPGAELAVATGSARDVWLLRQTVGGTEQEPIFALDTKDVFYVDIDQGGGVPIATAPASAWGDIEGDGDEELIFVDDLGRKVVVTSERLDQDALRVSLVEPESGWPAIVDQTLQYTPTVGLPPGAEVFDVEIWFRADVYAGDPPQLLTTLTGLTGGPTPISTPAPPGTAPAYQFVFRPVDTDPAPVVFPALVTAWSPDVSIQATDGLITGASYGWPSAALENDGGGGTTRNPVTGPPSGGGGTSSGG